MKPLIAFSSNHKWLLIVMLFLSAQGAIFVRDYGISWDEPRQREIGQASYNYIRGINNQLLEFSDRDYGVVVELPLVVLEYAFGLEDTKVIFLCRHIITHFIFLVGLLSLYFLVLELFHTKRLAILAALILAFTPRIYGHSFFNSKDIPFLAFYVICLYVLVRALRDKKMIQFALLGALGGLLIATRITGLFMVGVTFAGFFLLFMELKFSRLHATFLLQRMTVYLVFLGITTYVVWPYLWQNPVENFSAAFVNMSKFRWNGDVLFSGSWYKAGDLPWFYPLKWMAISTPVFFLIAGLTGVAVFLYQAVRNVVKTEWIVNNSGIVLCLIAFLAPILAVIVLGSVLYDDWRHLYFVYGPFVVFILYPLYHLEKSRFRPLFQFGLVCSMGLVMLFYWNNRGVQYVYFNEFVYRDAQKLRYEYEMDYWGLGYLSLFEEILRSNDLKYITVAAPNLPGHYNVQMIDKSNRFRVKMVEMDEHPDYFITNHRWHPGDYTEFANPPIYQLKVNGVPVGSVYDLRSMKSSVN